MANSDILFVLIPLLLTGTSAEKCVSGTIILECSLGCCKNGTVVVCCMPYTTSMTERLTVSLCVVAAVAAVGASIYCCTRFIPDSHSRYRRNSWDGYLDRIGFERRYPASHTRTQQDQAEVCSTLLPSSNSERQNPTAPDPVPSVLDPASSTPVAASASPTDVTRSLYPTAQSDPSTPSTDQTTVRTQVGDAALPLPTPSSPTQLDETLSTQENITVPSVSPTTSSAALEIPSAPSLPQPSSPLPSYDMSPDPSYHTASVLPYPITPPVTTTCVSSSLYRNTTTPLTSATSSSPTVTTESQIQTESPSAHSSDSSTPYPTERSALGTSSPPPKSEPPPPYSTSLSLTDPGLSLSQHLTPSPIEDVSDSPPNYDEEPPPPYPGHPDDR